MEDEYQVPQARHVILQDHIRRVAGHFRGKGFAGQSTKYIEQAFEWAQEADPDALLFYNDAEGEAVNAKSGALYAMVTDFRSHGVPIDGVGLQMHIFDRKPDFAGIEANIARFTALGVQVHITEMDVALAANVEGKASDPNDLAKQAEIYGEIARICIAHRGCTPSQTWGFIDQYSWIRSTKGAKGAALLFDRDTRPKAAYSALRSALSAQIRNLERTDAK